MGDRNKEFTIGGLICQVRVWCFKQELIIICIVKNLSCYNLLPNRFINLFGRMHINFFNLNLLKSLLNFIKNDYLKNLCFVINEIKLCSFHICQANQMEGGKPGFLVDPLNVNSVVKMLLKY